MKNLHIPLNNIYMFPKNLIVNYEGQVKIQKLTQLSK